MSMTVNAIYTTEMSAFKKYASCTGYTLLFLSISWVGNVSEKYSTDSNRVPLGCDAV
jgi:hypothetical protein